MFFAPRISASVLVSLAASGAGLAEGYACVGNDPDWRLSLEADQAQLSLVTTTEMEVMLTTKAQGQDWPRALTLIGDSDTAIVLLELETCNEDDTIRAHVMTQRGQTPILLTGCCQANP